MKKQFDLKVFFDGLQAKMAAFPGIYALVLTVDAIVIAAAVIAASSIYTTDRHIAKERDDVEATRTQILSWHNLAPRTEARIQQIHDDLTPACDAASDSNAFFVTLIDDMPHVSISHITLPAVSAPKHALLAQASFSATLDAPYRDLMRGLVALDRTPLPIHLSDYRISRSPRGISMDIDFTVFLPPTDACGALL